MSHGLEVLAGKAIERAARRRGWKPGAGQLHRFDRTLTAPFAATAWVSIEPGDDGSVVVEPGLWLSCPQAEQALIGLVRAEDGMVWAPTLGVDDPDEIVLRRPEDLDDMVVRVTAGM